MGELIKFGSPDVIVKRSLIEQGWAYDPDTDIWYNELDPNNTNMEELTMSLFVAYMKVCGGDEDTAWELVKQTLEKDDE